MTQIFICIDQLIGNRDGSDVTIAGLERLTDDIIDLVCLPEFLRPAFRLLALLGGYFEPRREMSGTFRLVRLDEDGNEVGTGEPDQVVEYDE